MGTVPDRLVPCLAAVLLLAALAAGMALTTSSYASFDAAAYYLQGLLLSDGARPYVGFVENKSPGIFYLLAVPARLFGWNPIGATVLFRGLELLWLWLLNRLLSALEVRREARYLALTVGYAAYLALFVTTWESVYVELPEAVLVAAALMLFVERRSLLPAGLCVGLAILMRQTAILPGAGIALLVLLEPAPARVRLGSFVRLCLGALLPIGGIVVVAVRQGWLEPWLFQAYVFNYRYMQAFDPMWTRILPTLGHLWRNDFLLAFGVALVVRPFLGHYADRATRILVVLWLVGLVEASGSGVLYRHHLIPWLGALVILLGRTLELLLRLPLQRVRAASLTVVAVLGAFVMVEDVRSAACLHTTDREQLVPVAAWIRAHTAPTDRILVWGFAPQLYLLSERRPASRHAHHLLLTNAERRFLPLEERFIREFRADLVATPPALIVVLSGVRLTPFFGVRLRDYDVLDPALGPPGDLRVLKRAEAHGRPA